MDDIAVLNENRISDFGKTNGLSENVNRGATWVLLCQSPELLVKTKGGQGYKI